MNINQIDEYLYLKAKSSIDTFFDYFSLAIKHSNEKKIKSGSKEEQEILKIYNRGSIEYQIQTSTLILNLTHIIELLLKSILHRKDEFLIFESIDNYPVEKEKWNKKHKEHQLRLEKIREKLLQSASKGHKENLSKYSKEWIPLMLKDEEMVVPRSVNLLNAVNRLQYFLKWKIEDDFIEKIKNLYYCRNEIIHFGYFYNVTFGCGYALHCLLNFSSILDSKTYPKMKKLVAEYSEHLKLYNDFMPNIIWHEIKDKVFNEVEILSKNMPKK